MSPVNSGAGMESNHEKTNHIHRPTQWEEPAGHTWWEPMQIRMWDEALVFCQNVSSRKAWVGFCSLVQLLSCVFLFTFHT